MGEWGLDGQLIKRGDGWVLWCGVGREILWIEGIIVWRRFHYLWR